MVAVMERKVKIVVFLCRFSNSLEMCAMALADLRNVGPVNTSFGGSNF